MARIILITLAVLLISAVIIRCSWKRPEHIGLVDGKLRECPPSPNCVSSQCKNGRCYVEPLTFPVGTLEARSRLIALLVSLPRVRIVEAEKTYIHAEFKTALFRFVDDVEFLIDEDGRKIHVRSASRIGYSDLGANRKRVEMIRGKYSGAIPPE